MLVGAHNLDIILAVIGGIIIALATSLHLLMKGRVTGFSGIVYSIIRFEKGPFFWKLSFVCGLWVTSCITFLNTTPFFDTPLIMISNLEIVGFGIAGFLVGFGTKLGNGCTSGHGVCGIPRLSIRSFVAVGCFMSFGLGLATLRYYRHFLWKEQALQSVEKINFTTANIVMLCVACVLFLAILIYQRKEKDKTITNIITFFCGALFSLGLIVSGMAKRSKIMAFLEINSNWDPSLMFVMASAVAINFITFTYIIQQKKIPIYNTKLEVPTNKVIDWRLIVGELLFGFGWFNFTVYYYLFLGGQVEWQNNYQQTFYKCPGPALILFTFMTPQITAVWFPCFAIGQYSVLALDWILKIMKKKDNYQNGNEVKEPLKA